LRILAFLSLDWALRMGHNSLLTVALRGRGVMVGRSGPGNFDGQEIPQAGQAPVEFAFNRA
jgi:hypothetical protein